MSGPWQPGASELLHLEDFTDGQTMEFGAAPMEEREIVEFARGLDPQPLHLDPEAAKATPFGGIIAGGWHTGSAALVPLSGTAPDQALRRPLPRAVAPPLARPHQI